MREASVELSDGGSSCQEAGLELDDDCIVIEDFLHESFGMEWQGDHFRDSHGNAVWEKKVTNLENNSGKARTSPLYIYRKKEGKVVNTGIRNTEQLNNKY